MPLPLLIATMPRSRFSTTGAAAAAAERDVTDETAESGRAVRESTAAESIAHPCRNEIFIQNRSFLCCLHFFTLAGVPTSPVLMIAYFSGECFLFFALFCDSFVNFNKKSSTKGKMYSKKEHCCALCWRTCAFCIKRAVKIWNNCWLTNGIIRRIIWDSERYYSPFHKNKGKQGK